MYYAIGEKFHVIQSCANEGYLHLSISKFFIHCRIHVEEKNDESLDLVFETIKKKNQGEYVCKAMYKGKEVTKNFTLSVFSKLFIYLPS